MTTHELKCEQPWFEAVWSGHKPFEIRKNDRNYQPGDLLVLRECWIDNDGATHYTGREATRVVTYVLRDGRRFGVAEDVAVLGLNQAGQRR